MTNQYTHQHTNSGMWTGERYRYIPVGLNPQEYTGLTLVQDVCVTNIPDIITDGLRILSAAVRDALPKGRTLHPDDLPFEPDLSGFTDPLSLTPVPVTNADKPVLRVITARLDEEALGCTKAISMLTAWNLSRVVRTGMLVGVNSLQNSQSWPGQQKEHEQRVKEAHDRLVKALPPLG